MTDEMLLLKEVEDYSLKLEETGTVKILFLSRECRTRDVIHLKIAIPKKVSFITPNVDKSKCIHTREGNWTAYKTNTRV